MIAMLRRYRFGLAGNSRRARGGLGFRFGLRRVRLLVVVVAVVALFPASAARAKNLYSLDAAPASPATVIQDGAGTAYIAWVHHSGGAGHNTPRFCKIPRGGRCTAPVAFPSPDANPYDVAGAFPVFGSGAAVSVVVPRGLPNSDVVVYSSSNGGKTFDGGVVIAAGSGGTPPDAPYSGKTNPTNVIQSGSSFLIGAYNPGLGFSSFGAVQGNFSFSSTGPGGVASSSMGLDSSGRPVEAYWNLGPPPYPLLFYRYGGVDSMVAETSWLGPTMVTHGYEPALAGGASGLVLVSQDYATPSSTEPSVVNVRKYNGTTFGAPVTLANDAKIDLFAGGSIGQAPSGRVAVVWPGNRAGDNHFVMRLFTSTNGGASFGREVDIANLPSDYAIESNARVALADNGQGWLTFQDGTGLEVADFNPIAPVPGHAKCVVPKLKGKKLKAAKKALKKAHCRLGKVKPKGHKKGKVKKQHPKAGTVRPTGSKVNIKLG